MASTAWLTKNKVTQTWAQHRKNGSLGGIDYAVKVGTPILAPEAGVVSYRDAGTGGWTVRITYSNGCASEFMHMSVRQPLPNGTHVSKDQQIGLSGGAVGSPGSGAATGPHIHAHDIDAKGVRRAFGTCIPKPVAAPPAASGWAFNEPAAAVQKRVQIALRKRGRYSGAENGKWGVLSIKGIQTSIKQAGFYSGPVNGVPGLNTCIGIQKYAQRFGGYTGPINGVLGVNGWAGFAKGLEKGLK